MVQVGVVRRQQGGGSVDRVRVFACFMRAKIAKKRTTLPSEEVGDPPWMVVGTTSRHTRFQWWRVPQGFISARKMVDLSTRG